VADRDRRRSTSRRTTPKGQVQAVPASGLASLTAAARRVPVGKKEIPAPLEWQEEAWARFDDTPELRFACAWYTAALSRIRLVVARRGAPGDDPTPVEDDHPASPLLDDLGSQEGQSQLLGASAPHLVVPGIAYLVAVDITDPMTGAVVDRSWKVLPSDFLRIGRTPDGTERWEAKDDKGGWAPVDQDTLPIEIKRRHPKRPNEPDSPLRALLGVLRELHLLTAKVEADATSRLAGAGVFMIPSETTMPLTKERPGDPDPFLSEFTDAMVTPIRDRGAASAVVPILMRVPGEHLGKSEHFDFSTGLDEQAIQLREEARRRFAAGMDMPAEVLLGLGDSNHWTAWQIEESAIKLHIAPMAETFCEGLDVGWFQDTLRAATTPDPVTGETLITLPDGDKPEDYVVWYDASNLTVRPDRSEDAKDLWDRSAIGDAALLRETGFEATDAPTQEELKRKLLVDILKGAPTLAPIIFPLLGIDVSFPEEEALPAGPAGAAPPTGEEPDEPAAGPGAPDTQDDPPPPPDGDPVAAAALLADEAAIRAAAADGAIIAAADAAVVRALERVGNRVRNLARRTPSAVHAIEDTPHEQVHTVLDVSTWADFDSLLAGAWDRLGDTLPRYGVDPTPVVATVDRYTRALLAARVAHEYEAIVEALDRQPAPA
jgi:hypothetical protein